jgi:hypothetical protein
LNLDLNTLATVVSLTYVVQIAALYAQYRVDKTHHGLGRFTLGSLLCALGFAVNLFQHRPAFGSVAIVANTALSAGGMALLYLGILSFLDQHERRGWLIGLCVGFTLIIFFFTYPDADPAARNLVTSAALAAISFLIAQRLFVNKIRSTSTPANF